LPLSEKLTYTPVFYNVKIGDMPLCLAEFKDLSVSNAMVCINPKTIISLVSITKPMKRPTYYTSKQKRQTMPVHLQVS